MYVGVIIMSYISLRLYSFFCFSDCIVSIDLSSNLLISSYDLSLHMSSGFSILVMILFGSRICTWFFFFHHFLIDTLYLIRHCYYTFLKFLHHGFL